MSLFSKSTVDDLPEFEALPEGEYKVRILGFTFKDNKNGEPYMLVKFEVVNQPTAKDFSRYFGLPDENIMNDKSHPDYKNHVKKAKAIMTFFDCFGIPINEFDQQNSVDYVGETGWVVLSLKDGGDEYGDQNEVKRFIVSK